MLFRSLTVVTVNKGIPTPDQILAGEDSTGALAVFSQSDVTVEPLTVNAIGLSNATKYYVFMIVQVDPDEPKQGQWSIIAQTAQVT